LTRNSSLVTVTIKIRREQLEWLKEEGEDINLSGFVRKKLDELIRERKINNRKYL